MAGPPTAKRNIASRILYSGRVGEFSKGGQMSIAIS
jgi:hypothetical protein